MYLNKEILQWSHNMKYLWVIRLKCDVDYISRKFYAASKCIFSNTVGLDELLQLSWQQAYCLPLLQYGTDALSLNDPFTINIEQN